MTNWKMNTLKVKESSYLVWVRCISARGKHGDVALHRSGMLFHIIAELTPTSLDSNQPPLQPWVPKATVVPMKVPATSPQPGDIRLLCKHFSLKVLLSQLSSPP